MHLFQNLFNMGLHVYKKSRQKPTDKNSKEVPNNLRYVTSSTSGFQSRGTDASAVAEYSRIGPSYETIDSRRQQPVAGRNVAALVRLSERYEFSEAHLVAAARGGGGQGETAMDYEVPLNSSQSEGHEEYSCLQH